MKWSCASLVVLCNEWVILCNAGVVLCNDGVVLHNVFLPCSIPPYSVIPTVPELAGLIGWCPTRTRCTPSCIRDYWERKKIMLNVEHRLMLQVGMGGGRWRGRGGEDEHE